MRTDVDCEQAAAEASTFRSKAAPLMDECGASRFLLESAGNVDGERRCCCYPRASQRREEEGGRSWWFDTVETTGLCLVISISSS